jgi:V8-like Glu-specific endopeptidase
MGSVCRTVLVLLVACGTAPASSATNATDAGSELPVLPGAMRYDGELVDVGAESPTRTSVNDAYTAVGVMLREGVPHCAGLLLRHDLFVTARHCAADPSRLTLVFLKKQVFSSVEALGADDVVVGPASIRDRIVDAEAVEFPANDLASYRIDPDATANVGLLTAKISTAKPRSGQKVSIIGFPSFAGATSHSRVMSAPCAFGARVGDIPLYGKNQFETTCPGWFGNSGGPALSFTPEGEPVLVGVVSHTFSFADPAAPNSIAPTGSDALGELVPVTVSPLSAARPR